jgi:nucleoside-diphosphate-sugar epimerase
MNAALPAFVCDKFRHSRIVAFSSGNVYPLVPLSSGGCTEDDPARPNGEYAMSCLARERVFEHAANAYGTKVLIYRLNFAVDLRYGVLCDLAEKLLANEPIPLHTPVFNIIWQGTANEIALRALRLCGSPAAKLNVTGPEAISVKYAAERMAKLLGVTPRFTGEPGGDAYLNNAAKCVELFGYPSVSAGELIDMQAEWFVSGGRRLNKPTHFEERGGNY